MPISNFKTVVHTRKQLSSDVIEITFQLIEPAEIEFLPGQFICIKKPTADGKFINRAYSICSGTHIKNKLKLCVKVLPDGQVSSFIGNLKVGDELTVTGPFGKFTVDTEHHNPLVLVATSTGIAPFMSMLSNLAEVKSKRVIKLYLGFKYGTDVFYQAELAKLKKSLPNFEYLIAVSRPEENSWDGPRGRLTQFIQEDLSQLSQHDFYLCGNPRMVDDIKMILAEGKIPAEQIFFEKY